MYFKMEFRSQDNRNPMEAVPFFRPFTSAVPYVAVK